MKKHILLIATTSLLAMQASADQLNNSQDDAIKEKTFYIKAFAGANKLNSFKNDFQSTLNKEDHIVRFKSKFTPFIGAGFGYYFTDIIRADLTLDCFANQQFDGKLNVNVIFPQSSNGVTDFTINASSAMKMKATIPTLLANAYVDMFDVGGVKFFAGAGVGVAKIKYRVTVNDEVNVTPADPNAVRANVARIQSGLSYYFRKFDSVPTVDPSTGQISINRFSKSIHLKNKYKFAYNLTLGASAEIKSGINVDLSYSWRDCGKVEGIATKGHIMSVGLRFDI